MVIGLTSFITGCQPLCLPLPIKQCYFITWLRGRLTSSKLSGLEVAYTARTILMILSNQFTLKAADLVHSMRILNTSFNR